MQRYLVNSETSLQEFPKIFERTDKAAQKNPQDSYWLSVDYDPRERHINKRLFGQLGKLQYHPRVSIFAERAWGPGTHWTTLSTCSWIHTPIKKLRTRISFLIDADQYDVSRSEVYEGFPIIGNALLREDKIIGLASRDEVELPEERQIEEMFQARVLNGRIKVTNPFAIDRSGTPKSYVLWGDPTPGYYAINMRKAFAESGFLLPPDNEVLRADFAGYAGDFYYVARGAEQTIGYIPSVVVPVQGNIYRSNSLKLIREKSFWLGRTSVRRRYLEAVIDERSEHLLCQFYPAHKVAKVKRTILEGLEMGGRTKKPYPNLEWLYWDPIPYGKVRKVGEALARASISKSR